MPSGGLLTLVTGIIAWVWLPRRLPDEPLCCRGGDGMSRRLSRTGDDGQSRRRLPADHSEVDRGIGMHDRSSQPHRLRRPTPAETIETIERPRRQRRTGQQIAAECGVSRATVSLCRWV